MYLVEIAFGHCRSDSERLPVHQVVAVESRALSAFAQYFSGSQIHRYIGSYLSANGHVMIEPCTVIRAYTEEIEGHMSQLFALAREIATALEQECVLLTIVHMDGVLHWVKSKLEMPLSKTASFDEITTRAVSAASLSS